MQQALLETAPANSTVTDESKAGERNDDGATNPREDDAESVANVNDGPNPGDEIPQEVLRRRKAELEEVVRKARADLNKLELQMD